MNSSQAPRKIHEIEIDLFLKNWADTHSEADHIKDFSLKFR